MLIVYFCMLHLATPVILTHPQPVVSKENDAKISLNCSAHDYGLGNVQYKWEKYQPSDDSWINPSVRHNGIKSPKLTFGVITEEDEGVYHCVATNDDGSVVSDNATVTVYGEFR